MDHYKKGSSGLSGQNIFSFLPLPLKQAPLFPVNNQIITLYLRTSPRHSPGSGLTESTLCTRDRHISTILGNPTDWLSSWSTHIKQCKNRSQKRSISHSFLKPSELPYPRPKLLLERVHQPSWTCSQSKEQSLPTCPIPASAAASHSPITIPAGAPAASFP